MTHNIIQTENYLLIVDDSEIKEGDYCLANAKTYNNEIVTYRKSPCPPPFVSNLNILKKIISHLPLNDAPILRGVDLLPPLADDVEKLAMLYARTIPAAMSEEEADYAANGFYNGYNKAKEKYKYTEEDLSKALSYGYHTAKDEYKGIPSSGYFTRFMQSLQQSKYPIEFECEIDLSKHNGQFRTKYGIKTITNSQGLTQWAGEYIY